MKFLDKCLEDKGESCPYCGNENIEYDEDCFMNKDTRCIRISWCNKCDRGWHNIYDFNTVVEK